MFRLLLALILLCTFSLPAGAVLKPDDIKGVGGFLFGHVVTPQGSWKKMYDLGNGNSAWKAGAVTIENDLPATLELLLHNGKLVSLLIRVEKAKGARLLALAREKLGEGTEPTFPAYKVIWAGEKVKIGYGEDNETAFLIHFYAGYVGIDS